MPVWGQPGFWWMGEFKSWDHCIQVKCFTCKLEISQQLQHRDSELCHSIPSLVESTLTSIAIEYLQNKDFSSHIMIYLYNLYIYIYILHHFTIFLTMTIFLRVNKTRRTVRGTFTSKGPAGRRTLQRGGFLARIMFMACFGECRKWWWFGENWFLCKGGG